MLEDIKKALGLNNTDLDSIINNYIEASKLDLEAAGILKEKIVDTDKLIYSAIFCFVQSKFDIDNSEMFLNSYNLQKDCLRHNTKYIS